MARKRPDPTLGPIHKKLTPPGIFLVRMLVFLTLVGFLAAILHELLIRSAMSNPGLNGLIIGVLQHGLSFADAAQTYTVLTVGDGLVAAIPSILVSVGAGMLVSKAGVGARPRSTSAR